MIISYYSMKMDGFNKKKTVGHLVLVRHGESVWNEKGLWTGWQDVPLSVKGRKEARFAAKTLADLKFDFAITSDLKRAHETLEIIKEELGLHALPTFKHHEYKERHYGIYTGKSKWDIKKEFGDEKFRKIRRHWSEPIPNGETLEDVYKRVTAHFNINVMPNIRKGLNVLIVAHGNTHRALIKHMENLSHEEIANIEMATGEVIVYKINEKGKVIHKEKRAVNKSRGKQ